MTPNSQSSPVEARPGWHAFFSDTVRFVLAPLILLVSGFFTANFIISGAYTGRDKSDVGATLTGADLSREFVYRSHCRETGVAFVVACSILVRSPL